MKNLRLLSSVIVLLLLASSSSWANNCRSKSGIGFRGNYWNMIDGQQRIYVYNDGEISSVNVGGFGGSLFFFTRVQEQLSMEFTLGALAAVVEHREYYHWEDVEVNAVFPLLFGFRYDLMSEKSRSAMQPYLMFGAGAYILNDISVQEYDYHEEEVSVSSVSRPGVYVGGGANLMLSNTFGFSYDIKYHWVDFDDSQYQNGFEFGLGLVFQWGRFRK